MNETHAELLREFRKATGYTIPIRPFERIIKTVVNDDRVAVMVETYRYTETRYEFRFTNHGKRIIEWDHGRPTSVTMWDDEFGIEFTPFVIRKSGHASTDAEIRDQIAFERDCYRPGTSRTPLDSYRRIQMAPSTDKMERYW